MTEGAIGLSPSTTGVVFQWQLSTPARASIRALITWLNEASLRWPCAGFSSY